LLRRTGQKTSWQMVAWPIMTPRWTNEVISRNFSPMPKSVRANDAPKNTPPFEEALKKLEAIVEAMESGDLPLETLLARYEEGTRLVQICQAKLAEAELKIQQLEKNAAGEMKLKSFETDEAER
jgi:exodeoxyribonuclease VII small subunit